MVPMFLKKMPFVFMLKPDSKMMMGNKNSVNSEELNPALYSSLSSPSLTDVILLFV